MLSAFENVVPYDLIYDQMCYSPLDAQISVRTFENKVKRYVMASTIEVYDHHGASPNCGFDESDFDASAHAYGLDFPWYDADVAYAEGKRQAEAYFAQHAKFDVVPVRIGHVISTVGDFTGRTAFYKDRLTGNEPISHSLGPCVSSFITPQLLVQFLLWVGQAEFTGPINSSAGELTVLDIVEHLAKSEGCKPVLDPKAGRSCANDLSPFDYPFPFATNSTFAREQGFRFDLTDKDPSGFAGLLPQTQGGR